MNQGIRFRGATAGARPVGHARLYPLQRPLIELGLISAALSLVFQDWVVSVSLLALFALVGATWRSYMAPVMPACIAYQWVFASAGYIYYCNFGEFPGGGYSEAFVGTLFLSLAGLGALVAGWRIALASFEKQILSRTLAPPAAYKISTLFIVTIVAFAINYMIDLLPMQIWFGGAQIIANLLALRFVPLFILLVIVFERQQGFAYAALATAFAIGPELLTGFSRFKEILFVVLIVALAQWKPWIRTMKRARKNRRMFLFAVVGALVIGSLGIIWSGGVKSRWRDQIWRQKVGGSPVERMALFFEVAGRAVGELDIARASADLTARMSSSALYFSYVTERVPDLMPHENGLLLGMAVRNATQPRFLFPEKANLGGDSWLVRQYAGLNVAGDESGASIGLGYLAEFYIDFGAVGVIALAGLWGFAGGAVMALLAKVTSSREVFLALVIGVFTQYFMSFGGSFIKLFPGMVQRTLIAAVVFAIAGRVLMQWLVSAPRRRLGGRSRPHENLRPLRVSAATCPPPNPTNSPGLIL